MVKFIEVDALCNLNQDSLTIKILKVAQLLAQAVAFLKKQRGFNGHWKPEAQLGILILALKFEWLVLLMNLILLGQDQLPQILDRDKIAEVIECIWSQCQVVQVNRICVFTFNRSGLLMQEREKVVHLRMSLLRLVIAHD